MRRCFMWNKWASRVVLFVIIWIEAFPNAAQAAARTSYEINFKNTHKRIEYKIHVNNLKKK